MRRHLTAMGLILLPLGMLLSVLMFFKPWRTCLEEDSSAGCPGGWESAVLITGMVIVLAGVVLTVLGLRGEAELDD